MRSRAKTLLQRARTFVRPSRRGSSGARLEDTVRLRYAQSTRSSRESVPFAVRIRLLEIKRKAGGRARGRWRGPPAVQDVVAPIRDRRLDGEVVAVVDRAHHGAGCPDALDDLSAA